MRSKGMRSRGDAGDPARETDEFEDPKSVMRWLRLAADVVERGPAKRGGGGKKGGQRADDKAEGKSAT